MERRTLTFASDQSMTVESTRSLQRCVSIRLKSHVDADSFLRAVCSKVCRLVTDDGPLIPLTVEYAMEAIKVGLASDNKSLSSAGIQTVKVYC